MHVMVSILRWHLIGDHTQKRSTGPIYTAIPMDELSEKKEKLQQNGAARIDLSMAIAQEDRLQQTPK